MQEVHLSNMVMGLIPEDQMHYLGGTFEDRNIEGFEGGKAFARWIAEHAPDAFVLIDTGDYLHADCDHLECETYDAFYNVWLVPSSVWAQAQEQVLAADATWREALAHCRALYMRCRSCQKYTPTTPGMYQWCPECGAGYLDAVLQEPVEADEIPF